MSVWLAFGLYIYYRIIPFFWCKTLKYFWRLCHCFFSEWTASPWATPFFEHVGEEGGDGQCNGANGHLTNLLSLLSLIVALSCWVLLTLIFYPALEQDHLLALPQHTFSKSISGSMSEAALCPRGLLSGGRLLLDEWLHARRSLHKCLHSSVYMCVFVVGHFVYVDTCRQYSLLCVYGVWKFAHRATVDLA